MFNIDVFTLLAFFGTFQGLIFAVIFWLRNNHIANKIFSLFLLATSIRIAKNIFVHLDELNPGMFASISEVWSMFVYIGIDHQFAIGPLFYLYFLAKLDSKFQWKKQYLWHFVPYFILILISPFITWNFWKYGGLWLSYISIMFYYLLTFWSFYRYQDSTDAGTNNWLKGLLVITALLLVSYSPSLFHYIGYIGGAVLYTLSVLVIGYIMLTNKHSFSFFRVKYESSSLDKSQATRIKNTLEQVMINDKPFLDPELTLATLASKISVQPHHLSRVINQEFDMNFSDYINSFRLDEAVERLQNPEFSHYKISALAYDCGFNSVPTFNILFKKTYKLTPSKYRQKFK